SAGASASRGSRRVGHSFENAEPRHSRPESAGEAIYTEARLPIYEYRCRQGHTFEVMQSMSDEPVVTCGECRAPVERIFRPVAVHFKGSGFYTTDYGRT